MVRAMRWAAMQAAIFAKIIVHPNKKVEIRLNLLPPSWAYVLTRLEELKRLKKGAKEGCHNSNYVSALFDTNPHFLQPQKNIAAQRLFEWVPKRCRCTDIGQQTFQFLA